jgi:hypothetical protein
LSIEHLANVTERDRIHTTPDRLFGALSGVLSSASRLNR